MSSSLILGNNMVIIGTKLTVVDNSGGKLAKCIVIKSKQKNATIGNLILVTLKIFFNKKKLEKRIIYLGLIIGVKYWIYRKDGLNIKFFLNSVLIFNKQFKFLGSRIYDILLKEVKMKNVKSKLHRTYFHKVIMFNSFL